LLTHLMSDVRNGLRVLIRMRGAAALAIATLAFGIAATTTMFSVAYAALVRSLPFADPGPAGSSLFTTRATPREGLFFSRWSRPFIDDLTASVASYESIASFTPAIINVSQGNGDPEQIEARSFRLTRSSFC